MPGIAICNSPILACGSPPPWTPAAVSGCILYGGGYQEARAVRAAQPVLVDGDMEAAGVAAWKLRENSALAKQGDPYAGLQCLRLTNAGFANRYTDQAVGAITGNRYRITGAARGDGSAHPRIGLGSTGYEWIGTTSNMWQPVSGDYNWTANESIFLYAYGADTKYAEFDALTLTNLSLQSYTPQYTTIPGSVLAQASATAQPWAGALGMMFDGDVMLWNAAASNVKCAHDGTGGTFGFAYRPTTLKAENRIIATAATAVGNVGVTVSCTNANTVRVRVMNGGGAYDYDSGDVACAIAINNTYAMVLRVASGAGGVSLRVNGTEVISGALTAPSAADPTTGLMLGGDAVGAATNITGYLGQVWVVQRAITVAECAQYESTVAAGGL
jgi:hypothetical protein